MSVTLKLVTMVQCKATYISSIKSIQVSIIQSQLCQWYSNSAYKSAAIVPQSISKSAMSVAYKLVTTSLDP